MKHVGVEALKLGSATADNKYHSSGTMCIGKCLFGKLHSCRIRLAAPILFRPLMALSRHARWPHLMSAFDPKRRLS